MNNDLATKLNQILTDVQSINTAVQGTTDVALSKTVNDIEDASTLMDGLVSGEIDESADVEGLMRTVDMSFEHHRTGDETDYSESEVNKVKNLFETLGGLI